MKKYGPYYMGLSLIDYQEDFVLIGVKNLAETRWIKQNLGRMIFEYKNEVLTGLFRVVLK